VSVWGEGEGGERVCCAQTSQDWNHGWPVPAISLGTNTRTITITMLMMFTTMKQIYCKLYKYVHSWTSLTSLQRHLCGRSVPIRSSSPATVSDIGQFSRIQAISCVPSLTHVMKCREDRAPASSGEESLDAPCAGQSPKRNPTHLHPCSIHSFIHSCKWSILSTC